MGIFYMLVSYTSFMSDHTQLMSVLNKMANAEKWRKMPKKKGVVNSVTQTKTGNIRITFDDNAKVYVLKRNKNLFELAETIKKGDVLSVATRIYLGKRYCTRIIVNKL